MQDWALVFISLVLFILLLLSPGLLFQMPVKFRIIEFSNFETSTISIPIHAILFFALAAIFLITVGVHMMEHSKGSRLNENSEECSPDVDPEQARINKGLDKLWDLCNVLGILYQTKISEFGSVVTEKRVNEAVKFLTVTRDTNFRKLKEISGKMTKAWKLCKTNSAKVQTFHWIFFIQEAAKAEDVMHWNLLSTSSVGKAEAEVSRLMKDREMKIQKNYKMKRTKLTKLLAETHLTAQDILFDMTEKVTADNYKNQKYLLKDAIRNVKDTATERMELVIRVEMAKKAVGNKNLSSEYQKAMIKLAEDAAGRMNKNEDPVPYDGQFVGDIFEGLHAEVARAVNAEPNEAEELPRTRSGKTGRH